jgi:HEXXH motif-containing protein
MGGSVAPWMLSVGPLSAAFPSGRWLWDRICTPSDSIRRHIEAQGLRFRPEAAVEAELFDATQDLIGFVPTLSSIVESWVGEVHILVATPGFDVSHSEPQWRSRIFVSKPERSDLIGGLRLAESIIHEAMHLQLTAYETVHPVVADESGRMPSPWRREPRPFRGVAHGLFVFTCLSAYFVSIANLVGPAGRAHVLKRVHEIREEIKTIHIDDLATGLTPMGAALARRWSTVALASAA